MASRVSRQALTSPQQGRRLVSMRPVRSPKLGGAATKPQYYRYLAGYTEEFVDDVLTHLEVPSGGLVVDPWNGAGTTTVAAAAAGLNATGFDINPVAVLIGRARLTGSDVTASLVPIAVEICERARSLDFNADKDDLLGSWFGPTSTHRLRAIERATHCVLVDPDGGLGQGPVDVDDHVSALASLFYVALFRTVRLFVTRFVASNPSWIKGAVGPRLGLTRQEIETAFVQSVRLSDPHVGQMQLPGAQHEVRTAVRVASSRQLPLPVAAVDAIVSSPPYCTRLDYVKSTLPELAILRFSSQEVRELRDRMIGTPTVQGGDPSLSRPWGRKTSSVLRAIREHDSKASKTYYNKYFSQYFAGMWDSLLEIQRVVKPGGTAVLVVQDSFYKDVHVDLPGLIGSMAAEAGWAGWERHDFPVPRTMASIHPGARAYRSSFRAVESAVLLAR